MRAEPWSKLAVGYAVVGIVAVATHFGLKCLSGYIYRHGLIQVGDHLLVDRGTVYRSPYTGDVVWHAVAALLIVTAWHLTPGPTASGVSTFRWLLTSRRVNVIACILFVFAGLGLIAVKGGIHDQVDSSILVLDLVLVLAVILRTIGREAYLWRLRRSEAG